MDSQEYFELLKEIAAQGRECHMLITGNSMAPFLYHERDTVYFTKPPVRLKTGDIVFFQRKNGQFVMHRIRRIVRTQRQPEECFEFYLVGDNQHEVEGPLKPEQIKGVLTAFIRRGKQRSVKNPIYILASRLWLFLRPVRPVLARTVAALKRPFHKQTEESI